MTPRASPPFKTYRYKGRYGYIWIGAMNRDEALREAARSTDDPINPDNLEEMK